MNPMNEPFQLHSQPIDPDLRFLQEEIKQADFWPPYGLNPHSRLALMLYRWVQTGGDWANSARNMLMALRDDLMMPREWPALVSDDPWQIDLDLTEPGPLTAH